MFNRLFWITCLIITNTTVLAWQMPPAPVGVTAATTMEIAREISLTGSVYARRYSQVSARIAAAVTELPVEEGDRVEQGRVLVKLEPTPYLLMRDVTRARIQETEARLKLAQVELERARELHQTKVVSIQDLDRAVAETTALKGALATLKAEEAQNNFALEHTNIRAPFDGILVMRHTEVGQWVTPGTVVFDIITTADPDVWIEAPVRYFGDFSVGTPATLTFDALPDLRLPGRVRTVIPLAGSARTFRVKIGFQDPDGRVPAGMPANAALRVGNEHSALAVPKDAVLDRGGIQIVFVVDPENKAQQVQVTTGLSNGDWVEISGELQPGQKVITLGNERIFPGQMLNPQERTYKLP